MCVFPKTTYMGFLDYRKTQVRDLGINPSECSFNPGVIVADVVEWRRQKITKQLEGWMQNNIRFNPIRDSSQICPSASHICPLHLASAPYIQRLPFCIPYLPPISNICPSAFHIPNLRLPSVPLNPTFYPSQRLVKKVLLKGCQIKLLALISSLCPSALFHFFPHPLHSFIPLHSSTISFLPSCFPPSFYTFILPLIPSAVNPSSH